MIEEEMRSAPAVLADYPAAHSMDTTWYAVDENGEIGEFLSEENGYVPAPKGIPEDKLNTPESLDVDKDYREMFKFHDPCQIKDARRPHFDELGDDKRNYDVDVFDFVLSLPRRYHFYGAPWSGGYYYWIASPAQPVTVRDLPGGVLERVDLVYLRNYTFRSRDPINPFDYRLNCYGEFKCRLFPHQLTSFPIPSCRNFWKPEDMPKIGEEDAAGYFFAVDDADCVALFRTDRFGAIPKAQWRARDQYEEDWGVRLWKEMTAGGPRASAFPRAAYHDFKAWPENWAQKPGWVRHWLEYPFAPAAPRLFGLFHYDMSWHHAGPYIRIAAPEVPVRLGEFSPEWREKMKPVHLKGARFAAAELIQPFEFVDCVPGTLSVIETELPMANSASVPLLRRAQSQVWIDAALESVHPSSEDSAMPDDERYLLRRARDYYEMIRSLSRPDRP